jgi:excinuclease ABC subunit B
LHKIVPKPIVSKLDNSILEFLEDTRKLNTQQQQLEEVNIQAQEIPLDSLPEIIQLLEEQMKRSAKELEFEKAAQYRDKIKQLRERL